MKNNEIRLSGIAWNSLVNGSGMRRVFFSQGCKHNCKGCFNPDTHDFNGGELRNMDELIKDVIEDPILRGVTFSGGDPWEQAPKFAYMARKIKEAKKSIWSYTGYTFEYILAHLNDRVGWKDLIYNIDVLVDGRFEEDLTQDGLKFKGSTNQRIIDVPASLKANKIILWEEHSKNESR